VLHAWLSILITKTGTSSRHRRAGVIPIVTASPGYVSYGVMVQDKQVVSISQWESEAHAKATDAALGEWVKANTTVRSERRYTGDLSWLELASR
jgi:hypothetical protein